jgi:predicted oxidoreductase
MKINTINVNGSSATITGGEWSVGTSTSIMGQYSMDELVKTIVKEDCIELIYKKEAMWHYTNGVKPDPVITKRVYGVVDGKFGLIKTVSGKYSPVRVEPESYDFNE